MQNAQRELVPYLPFLFPFFAATVWALSCFLPARISGWNALSKRFLAQTEPYGDTRTAGPFFYTVSMRFWIGYSSVIRLTAAADALYLSVSFLFRIGHPPLSIPWTEIRFGRTTHWGFRYVVLTLGGQEQIPMRISERLARNLGLLERIPDPSGPSPEPKFDTLSETFAESKGKK